MLYTSPSRSIQADGSLHFWSPLALLLLNVTLRLLFVMVLALKWITHRKRLPEINQRVSQLNRAELSFRPARPGLAHSPIGTCVFGAEAARLDWFRGTYRYVLSGTGTWKKVFLVGASLSASRGFSAKRHLFTAFRFQLRYKLSLMLESCFRNRRPEDSA